MRPTDLETPNTLPQAGPWDHTCEKESHTLKLGFRRAWIPSCAESTCDQDDARLLSNFLVH